MAGRSWGDWTRLLPPRVRQHRAQRPLLVDVALVVILFCLVWPFVDWWLRPDPPVLPFAFFDWDVYVEAIERWQAGDALYVRREGLGFHGGYLYPPLVLLFLVPFVVPFEPAVGAALWAVVSVLVLWIALQLLVRELGYALRWWERGLLLWAVVGYQPVLLTIKMGQLDVFLVGLLCLAYVAAEPRPPASRAGGEESSSGGGNASERGGTGDASTSGEPGTGVETGTDDGTGPGDDGRETGTVTAGALTGFVLFVKASYAPVGAHLLVERRRLAGAVATGGGLLAASVAIFGVDAHLTFLEVLEWGVRFGNDARQPQIARPTYFMPLNWLPGSLAVRVGASLLIAVVVARSSGRSRESFALGLAAFPLLVPTGYSYYLIAVLPAALVMLAVELERDGRPVVPVLAVGLASAQVHGVRFLTGWLPEYLTILTLVDPLYPLLQPGLWGTLTLSVLAYARVLEGVQGATVVDWGRRGLDRCLAAVRAFRSAGDR